MPLPGAMSTSAGSSITPAARSPIGAGIIPDCAQWGMGTELTGPIEIRNVKGEFPPDPLWNTATDFHFEAVYENGVTMVISNQNRMGVTFEGTKGTIYANRGEH